MSTSVGVAAIISQSAIDSVYIKFAKKKHLIEVTPAYTRRDLHNIHDNCKGSPIILGNFDFIFIIVQYHLMIFTIEEWRERGREQCKSATAAAFRE